MNQSFARANRSLNRVAQKATKVDADGLAKAAQILETIQSELPDDAATGLDTARRQLSEAMNRSAATGSENRDQSPATDQQPSVSE